MVGCSSLKGCRVLDRNTDAAECLLKPKNIVEFSRQPRLTTYPPEGAIFVLRNPIEATEFLISLFYSVLYLFLIKIGNDKITILKFSANFCLFDFSQQQRIKILLVHSIRAKWLQREIRST